MKRRIFCGSLASVFVGISGCNQSSSNSPTFRHQIIDHQLSEPLMNDELAGRDSQPFRSGIFDDPDEVRIDSLHSRDRESLDEYDYSRHFLAIFTCEYRLSNDAVDSSVEGSTFVFSFDAMNHYRTLTDEQFTIVEVWEEGSNGTTPEVSEVRIRGH